MGEKLSLYARRKAEGLCGMCGKVQTGGELCDGCKQKCKDRAAAKREKVRASGGCLDCGIEIESGTRCEDCKERQKLSREKAVQHRKKTGQCTVCSNKAKEGCTLCQSCIDKRSAVSSEHYRRRKESGLCRFCNSEPTADGSMCEYHKEKYRDYRISVKLEVLEQYGGAFCAMCGCKDGDDVEVLELDHINGGGTKHRKELNMRGYQFYLWLRQQGYPKGYRVLCPTCNKKAHVTSKKGGA